MAQQLDNQGTRRGNPLAMDVIGSVISRMCLTERWIDHSSVDEVNFKVVLDYGEPLKMMLHFKFGE